MPRHAGHATASARATVVPTAGAKAVGPIGVDWDMTGQRISTRTGRAALLAAALALPLSACGAAKDATSFPAATTGPASSSPAASSAPADTTAGSAGAPSNWGVRAAHIMSYDWPNADKREPILNLIKEKKLDAVQLDIKDEDGLVGYDSKVPLAVQAGTTAHKSYDIKEAVDTIHALGAKVIGRIVAFRDPRMGKWALTNGHMDYLIQNTSGGAYNAGSYGTAAFTNFANPDIIEYNIGLGEEAAKAGFDAIMYDYIRKPENQGQVYPGIGSKTPSQAIADFVAKAEPRIHAAGAQLGAAVFGVSAFTPTLIAQDIRLMAPHLDFISPMIYPSHWGPGEYSVSSPVHQPYEIVKRSLMDFNRQVLGTDCRVVPWIQNFSWPIPYSADDVAAQIRAAKDVGINSFYLWNDSSKVGLGAPALIAHDASGDAPGTIRYSINKPGNASDGTTDAAKAKAYIDAYWAWVDAGKQGTFVSPLDPAASATGAPTSPATSAPSSTPAPTSTP
jgi:hypothetical protein